MSGIAQVSAVGHLRIELGESQQRDRRSRDRSFQDTDPETEPARKVPLADRTFEPRKSLNYSKWTGENPLGSRRIRRCENVSHRIDPTRESVSGWPSLATRGQEIRTGHPPCTLPLTRGLPGPAAPTRTPEGDINGEVIGLANSTCPVRRLHGQVTPQQAKRAFLNTMQE